MIVEPESPVIGRSIEEAGLRHLRGMFLAEIQTGNVDVYAGLLPHYAASVEVNPDLIGGVLIRTGDTTQYGNIILESA